jgi:tricorn protease
MSLNGKRHLKVLEIKNKDIETKTLLEEVDDYELSYDGKKIMAQKKQQIYIVDAGTTAPSELNKSKVDLSDWTFTIDPREEWRQMFVEAWRLERDYFYDPQMHGVDYEGLLNRYLPYVNRVMDRNELSDLISHLVGELSALHTYVFGGDIRKGEDDIKQGFLGAKLIRNEREGGYQIEHIYQADPNYPDTWSPLAKPEVNAQEEDIITAVDGVSLLNVSNPGELLKNKVGKQVLLNIKSSQNKKSQLIVKPISASAERNLRYDEWELQRRLQVEAAGNKEIGYVHLRAMGGGNYSEWVRNYFPVFNRRGLIIDVRHNRGGNIDSWILEKLLRKAWFYWQGRIGKPYWNMQYAFRGHMVVLCNERTASDGEAFSEGFRRLGLGKIIGTRTWGGEIWLSYNNRLVDKGMASAAQTGVYGPEGKWLIEGHGVEPDIVVDNPPHQTFKGVDSQLEAAIKYLQEKIKNEPVDVPPPPPFPDKSFDYNSSR